jgi:hypothetical protein
MSSKKKKQDDATPSDDIATSNEAKRTKMQQEFDTLRREMEIAVYATNETGQLRRKMPRNQSAARTQKRKLLEQQDAAELAEHQAAPAASRKRLRGSRAATEDHVIQGSLIFGSQTLDEEPDDKEEPEELADVEAEIDNDVEEEGYEEEEEADEDPGEDQEEDDDDDDVDDDDNDDDDEEEVADEESARKSAPVVDKAKDEATTSTVTRKPRKKKHKLHRMKNFTSQKMARRHGDALGAHARGMPKVAIQKLKEIAKQVPSASQVYSSLGMVYEDMLRESHKRQSTTPGETGALKEQDDALVDDNDAPSDEDYVPDKLLAEQLDLGRKAYGSYHVAAILCKKDYTLWVRAADSAAAIADLHSSVMVLPGIVESVRHFHKFEKERWLSEAKSDYKVADHLKPPGIDVPAKLAAVLIELGSLSEALTLLTDLKNSGSEFGSSYRAWILYADLMLRIGHECTQWNRGIQTNENFMFRRWLRKLSRTFDWGERRLQALSKALETATGSKSSSRYMEWLQQQTSLINKDAGKDVANVVAFNENGSVKVAASSTPADAPTAEQFEREKSLLLDRNQFELSAFDKTTMDMVLEPGSIPAKQRVKTRTKLISGQKATVVDFVGEYHQSNPAGSPFTKRADESGSEQTREATSTFTLPPSASCVTVNRIAAELMRHLLDAQIYTGAKLVGGTISCYLRDRAAQLDKRTEARKQYEQTQTRPTSIFAFQNATYDAVDDHSEGGESDVPLSDNDDLEANYEAPNVQQSLRRGVLPPELQVLYGLSLIGEGGSNFLAAQCLESLDALEHKARSWWDETITNSDPSSNSSWVKYHRATTESLGRTAAYALTADVLRATGKEEEMAGRLATLFTRHFDLLKEEGALDLALRIEEDAIHYDAKYQATRTIIASLRYQVYQAEMLMREDDGATRSEGRAKAIAIVDLLMNSFLSQWKVQADASVTVENTEMLGILSRAFAVLSKDEARDAEQKEKHLADLIRKLQMLACTICGGIEFDLLDRAASEKSQHSTADLSGVPFPTYWLSPIQERLVLRTYNLCIATNVSLFSGWEDQEFSLRLLRHRDVDNFFGLTMADDSVSGYLGPCIERELSDQWDALNSQLPETCAFDFQARLEALKQTQWYTENKERHALHRSSSIASYGEDSGLLLLLSLSRACLLFAADLDEASHKDKLLFTSLSILLPMSQFSLNPDKKLWDPKVGKEATEKATVDQVEQVSAKELEERLDAVHGRSSNGALMYRNGTLSRPRVKEGARPINRRSQPLQKTQELPLHDWFGGEKLDSHLTNLISIPCDVFQRVWMGHSIEVATLEFNAAAAQAMNKLHTSMQELRMCFTEHSVEKSSLQASEALVELVEFSRNPFLCLQQAAIFAGQAIKGGNSNLTFKVPLPRQDACTPLEALVILGRADCLQAVYFCPEAAFLCSYVASVCARHRKPGEAHLAWNERWKIVCILAYNVSVMIRHTALVILQEQDKRDEITMQWQHDNVEELERGRADGMRWKTSISHATSSAPIAVVPRNLEFPSSMLLQGGTMNRRLSDADIVEV